MCTEDPPLRHSAFKVRRSNRKAEGRTLTAVANPHFNKGISSPSESEGGSCPGDNCKFHCGNSNTSLSCRGLRVSVSERLASGSASERGLPNHDLGTLIRELEGSPIDKGLNRNPHPTIGPHSTPSLRWRRGGDFRSPFGRIWAFQPEL